MVEIRIHGRGGQGAVSAAQILASAFFKEGKYIQSFSSFGGERRGVPVVGFVRADDRRIRLRCEITSPDHIVCLDSSLIEEAGAAQGVKEAGLLLINSERGPEDFRFNPSVRVFTVNAEEIAWHHRLGGIVNTAILGAYARASQLVNLETVIEVIRETVPANVRANEEVARQAYAEVRARDGDL